MPSARSTLRDDAGLDARHGWDEAAQVDQFRTFVGWLVVAVAAVGTVELALALVYRDPWVGATGATLAASAIYLLSIRARIGREPIAALARRTVAWLLVLIGVNALVQPSGAEVITVAALLPVITGVPFLRSRDLLLLMVVGWVVAIGAVAANEYLPHRTMLPAELVSLLRIATMGGVVGLVMLLVWQWSDRLKTTARDLASILSMSRALSHTLEARRVADMTARHMAEALGADECGISLWDRGAQRVLTYGYHPIERRAAIADSYDLASYPASRRVLEQQRPVAVTVDDPDADPAESAYLRSIGQRSMAMVPLVARGRSVGIVELTSGRPAAFDLRRMDLALTLAGEAALAMDNARLFEDIREQASHDPLTGLANRTRFTDRLAEALAAGPSDAEGSPAPRIIGLLYVDLDDFKRVNEVHGHPGGDRVLVGVAERLRACLRPTDIAARLGGDEFAVLLDGPGELADAVAIAERVCGALGEPHRLDEALARCPASVGLAVGAPGTTGAGDLLRDADEAMFEAKRRGKGRVAVAEAGSVVAEPGAADGASLARGLGAT